MLSQTKLILIFDIKFSKGGKEGEWEGVFIDELAVALGVVFADAENTDAVGFIDGPLIAEIAGLLGAPRSVIFGIEIDDDPLTA